MSNIKLTKDASELLDKSNEERIAYISQDRWINYPLAQDIIDMLENIKTYEKNKTRVTSILLVGSSNNGKTSLLNECWDAKNLASARIHTWPPYA